LVVIAWAGLLALTAGIHLGWLWRFTPRVPQGDECDYLARSQWPDPHRPEFFLRVPVMPALFQLAGRVTGDPERVMRFAGTGVGVLTVVLVMMAGVSVGGPLAGGLAAIAMLLLVERVILSTHLWPDTPLSTLHALALLLLSSPTFGFETQWLALGAVVAMAAMIRIEQLALAPGVALVLLVRDPGDWLAIASCVLGPTVLATTLWTAVAWRRYRIALPDTTWKFNLRILDRQLAETRGGPVSVHGTITGILATGDAAATTRPGNSSAKPWKPWAYFVSILRRAAACMGPDTFVEGRLLPPIGQAYPAMSETAALRLRPWLRWSFPLLVVSAVWAMLASGYLPDYLIAAVPVFAALVVAHFRTRYRLVLMPWLCVACVDALARLRFETLGLVDLAIAAALLILTWLNVRYPLVVEDSRQVRGR
jgi:hypothetical protein